MNDRLEERVAIVVMEDPSFSGTMLERVSAVVGAMEALQRGGFTALLVERRSLAKHHELRFALDSRFVVT